MDARPPNWYLDPLVAAQKRQAHHEWIRQNVPPNKPIGTVLKTDLFEEAYGIDELLFSFPVNCCCRIGMDASALTVAQAASRDLDRECTLLTADVRRLPLADGCLDLVLSNSTLDHFETELEIEQSVKELARVLKPGGILLLTLDNPLNPTFALLRGAAAWTSLSFPLGKTLTLPKLLRLLRRVGMESQRTGWLLHNPRFISTLLFLALRRCLGRRAEPVIRVLLRAFSGLQILPTRSITGVFIAVCAKKPCATEYSGD